MRIGQFRIRSFVEQEFRLDGGLMWGVVPKTLWQRYSPADDNNLIRMVNNIFLLEAHGKRVLFDIGLGDTLSEKERKVYGTDGASSLDRGLASFGLTPTDIDLVVLTHLHTDHAAGAVALSEKNHYVPRYSNATYVVAKREWEAAVNPDERTRAVYIPNRLYPLREAGQLELIDGSTELLPGVNAVHTGGHSVGHFALEMESDDQRLFYYADIFPSHNHMRVPYVPATDVLPMESMAVKRAVLPRLYDPNTILAFDHDIAFPFGRVTERDGKPVVTRVDDPETQVGD